MGSYKNWSVHLAQEISDYERIGNADWEEIAEIEIFPGIRLKDDFWIVPEQWLAQGPQRRASFRTFDVSLTGNPVDTCLLTQLYRRSLLGLMVPRSTMTGVRQVGISTWCGKARKLKKMASWATQKRTSSRSLWCHLNADDLQEMPAALCSSSRDRQDMTAIMRDLKSIGLRNILVDFPDISLERDEASIEPGERLEKSNRKRVVLRAGTGSTRGKVQPFSDEFVTETVRRVCWLQDNLAEQLLDCWSALHECAAAAQAAGRETKHPAVINQRRAIIAGVAWKDANGVPITRLPWAIELKRSQGPSTAWPPTDARQIEVMVGVLQALNYCVTDLCTGGRSSEMLDTHDSSIHQSDPNRLHARTFKITDTPGGEKRDWPIHPRVARSLQLQKKIASVIRPVGTDHLWMLLQPGAEPPGSPLRNVNEPIVQAVARLGLTNLTGGARPHSHRWRHTIARLVAVCVASAPQVLMDLFGHRDLEMTLHYMLSDPLIAEEVTRVAKEISFVLASDAFDELDAGTVGGPAAQPLRAGVASLKMRKGIDVFGTDSRAEAVEILTFNGRSWKLVRDAVLCTKGPGEFGPCTKGRGEPNPADCRSDCPKRLELSRAKNQCESALRALLAELDTAVRNDAVMVVANLEGQILAELKRWDDVRHKILSENAAASLIWANAA